MEGKMMKKTIPLLLAAAILTSALSGCRSTQPDGNSSEYSDAAETISEAQPLNISNGPIVVVDGVLTEYHANLDKSVTVPDGVTAIADRAFGDCRNLTSITLPVSVTSIGALAFAGCEGLKDINIPDGVTDIGYGAFSGCYSLTDITLPAGLTSISTSAFEVCKNLKSITIPDGVADIGSCAFVSCENLASVTIPDSVTYIGKDAFKNTPWLDSQSDELVLAGNYVLIKYNGTDKDITLPAGIKSIGATFCDNSSITSISIPDSVTAIDYYAFCNCTNLASISIPDSVTSINDYAFSNCTSLASISIPDSVDSIGTEAFSNCTSLTSITIPDSVTSIGIDAFSGTKLNSISYKGKTYSYINIEEFYDAVNKVQ